jgi:hypothetical protein
MLKFFDVDPGSGKEKSRIREKHPGTVTLVLAYSGNTWFAAVRAIEKFSCNPMTIVDFYGE